MVLTTIAVIYLVSFLAVIGIFLSVKRAGQLSSQVYGEPQQDRPWRAPLPRRT